MASRREFVIGASAVLGATLLERNGAEAQARGAPPEAPPRAVPSTAGGYTPVITPNGVTLEPRIVGGVKVFHLRAEPVRHEMAPGLMIDAWGYNGRTVGPTIEVVEGETVRVYVENRLPEPTTVHWHGVAVPNGMDGVSGLSQVAIPVGKTFRYEFAFDRAGTFMYHPHFDEMTQMAMGMMGMIVVHPRLRRTPRADREFAIMLGAWLIRPGTSRPDPNAMSDFNMLTMNSKAFPGTAPLLIRRGERVRIRFGNLSAMDHHPIHLHGPPFKIVATNGGEIPATAQIPETSVLVPVGTTRDIEFVATMAGDWAMHCHMTHHVMNQMGHNVPNTIGMDASGLDARIRRVLPSYMTMGHTGMGSHAAHAEHMPQPRNSISMRGGPGPFGNIDMGGMFTILKVREGELAGDGGWYENPPGSVAREATEEEMRGDGVNQE